MKVLFLLLFPCITVAGQPSCQTYGKTERSQLSGSMDASLAIVTAESISDSYISNGVSVTTFERKKIWKDQMSMGSSNILKVRTRYPETLIYSKGETYILYLTYAGSSLFTNICLGTKNIENISKVEMELLTKYLTSSKTAAFGSDAGKTRRPF